jgi:hypothetical protein
MSCLSLALVLFDLARWLFDEFVLPFMLNISMFITMAH